MLSRTLCLGLAATALMTAAPSGALGQPLYWRIADTNTQLPEGQLGDVFTAFDIGRSSLSASWAAFYGEGVDSVTGFESGIYANRGNFLGTVGDIHDTLDGGTIVGFNQPLIVHHDVYVSPAVAPGTPGIARSPYDHSLQNLGGEQAANLVSANSPGSRSPFPIAYHAGSTIATLAGAGLTPNPVVSVGDSWTGVGDGQVISIGDFDYRGGTGVLCGLEFSSGVNGVFRIDSGGSLAKRVDNSDEIPGTGLNFELFDSPILPGGDFLAAFVGGRGGVTAPDSVRGIYAVDQGGNVVTIAQRDQPANFGVNNAGNWVSFDPVLARDDSEIATAGSAPPPQFAFRGTTDNFRGVFLVDANTGAIRPAYLEPDTFHFQPEGGIAPGGGGGGPEFFAFNTAIGRDSLDNGKILVTGDVSEVGVFPLQNIKTLFIIDTEGTGFSFPGSSQDDPIVPDTVDPDGTAFFDDAPSGMWFDPPLVDGYTYQTTDGSLFTAILDFPAGFAAPFEVLVDGQSLGLMSPGDQLFFPGGGVAKFAVRGIMPPDDLADGLDFPLRIAFDMPIADFTITPVPEPATLVLLATGVLCGGWWWGRRARQA